MQDTTRTEHTKTLPMPPHLHRRPPLRQPLPSPRRVLLLPPHHPKTRRQPAASAAAAAPPSTCRSPKTAPPSSLHRRSPPAHRRQRHRPPPRRPPPLRPPDRQPQPPQTQPQRKPDAEPRNRRRDHHRPRTRHPRPARRSLSDNTTKKHSSQTHRAHHAKRTPPAAEHISQKEQHPAPAPEPATIPSIQATADISTTCTNAQKRCHPVSKPFDASQEKRHPG